MPQDPRPQWRERIERARELSAPCVLCAHRCGVDRLAGEQGRCGASDSVHIYSKMLHFGEEYHLIPSYIVSFSGCSMHCTFCSEDQHLRPPFRAPPTQPEALVEHLIQTLKGHSPRAKNINFVGGEPSIHLLFLLKVAKLLSERWPKHPPLLLNTNGYLSPEAMTLCEGVFDIYVVDLKFGPGACGRRIGMVDDYFEWVTRSLLHIAKDPNASLLVRHLLMPGHFECCTAPVLRWCAEHLPQSTLNLMPSFIAFSSTRAVQRWGSLGGDEREEALKLLKSLNIRRALWNGDPLPKS